MSPLPRRSRTWELEPGLAYIPQYVHSTSSRSTVGSSHYLGTLLITGPIEDALVRKVNEMGRQLEALKMRFECPYEEGFNTASAFTSKIMEEPVPP